MKDIDPIRIHGPDDDAAARARHAELEDRLEALGPNQVGLLMATGGFPTQQNPIITAWLAGQRLKRETEPQPPAARPEPLP